MPNEDDVQAFKDFVPTDDPPAKAAAAPPAAAPAAPVGVAVPPASQIVQPVAPPVPTHEPHIRERLYSSPLAKNLAARKGTWS